MSRLSGKSLFVVLGLGVLALDQWTKLWIELTFELYEVRAVLPSLNLTRVENTGVAFGLLPARGSFWGTLLLTVLGLLALGVVLIFFLRARRSERWLLTGLGIILGGAVGNLIDRVLSGAVTDFVDFYVGTYHWHTFNVADSAITLGIVFMILDALLHRESSRSDPGGGEPALDDEG